MISGKGVLQFDQYFEKILFVAHINKRQGSGETSWKDSKQVLELRDAHMAGWSCGVASNQRLRQVGDHKTKPHHTQKDLKWQGSYNKANLKKHCKTIQTHLEEPRQDGEGACYLDSVRVPGSNVHAFGSISAVHDEVTAGRQPLRHAADHDADHSERTWIQTAIKWGGSVGSCWCACDLTHRWRCVWMCQRGSTLTPGRARCTGRTLAVRRPGAHMPCLFGEKKQINTHHIFRYSKTVLCFTVNKSITWKFRSRQKPLCAFDASVFLVCVYLGHHSGLTPFILSLKTDSLCRLHSQHSSVVCSQRKAKSDGCKSFGCLRLLISNKFTLEWEGVLLSRSALPFNTDYSSQWGKLNAKIQRMFLLMP